MEPACLVELKSGVFNFDAENCPPAIKSIPPKSYITIIACYFYFKTNKTFHHEMVFGKNCFPDRLWRW